MRGVPAPLHLETLAGQQLAFATYSNARLLSCLQKSNECASGWLNLFFQAVRSVAMSNLDSWLITTPMELSPNARD